MPQAGLKDGLIRVPLGFSGDNSTSLADIGCCGWIFIMKKLCCNSCVPHVVFTSSEIPGLKVDCLLGLFF